MASFKTLVKTTGYLLFRIAGAGIKALVAPLYGPIEGIRNLVVGYREKSELQGDYNRKIFKKFNDNNKISGFARMITSPIAAILNSFLDIFEDLQQISNYHFEYFGSKTLMNKCGAFLAFIIKAPIIIAVDLLRMPLKTVRTIGTMMTAMFENNEGMIYNNLEGYYYNGRYLPEFFQNDKNFEQIGGLLSFTVIPASIAQVGNDVISCGRSIKRFYDREKFNERF